MEEIYTVDGESYEQVAEQLERARDDMIAITKKSACGPGEGGQMEVISYSNGSISMHPLPMIRECCLAEDFGGFALIINGHSLVEETSL